MKNLFITCLIAMIGLTSCFDDDFDAGLTFEEQLAIDTALIDSYLRDRSIEAIVHPTQIRYTIDLAVEDADSPTLNDIVEVKYRGTFLNEEEFDENSVGISFPLNNLIPAWQIMIPEMRRGEIITIYAPSVWCYGSAGRATIPPNANLIFEIELVDF